MLILLICLISASTYLLADLYLPSFPILATYFNSNSTAIQYSMSIYLLSLAFFQLIWGPVSDTYGRKKIILLSILISLFGTVVCIYSVNIYIFLLGRFIQGVGAAALYVLTRAMARDLFSGVMLARVSSYQGIANNLFSAISPVLGSYLILTFNWESVFVVLLFVLLVIFILTILYGTDTRIKKTSKSSIVNIDQESFLIQYNKIIKNSNFVFGTLISSGAMGGLVAYLTLVPFLYQKVMGISISLFGWLGMSVFLVGFVTKLVNSFLVKIIGFSKMFIAGSIFMLFGSCLMLSLYLMGFLNFWVVLLPFCLFAVGTALIFSNSPPIVMHDFKYMAGTASSIYGCIQILGGVVSSSVIAHVSEYSQLGLSVLLCLISLTSIIFLFFINWTNQ